jgi:hypothetical protein
MEAVMAQITKVQDLLAALRAVPDNDNTSVELGDVSDSAELSKVVSVLSQMALDVGAISGGFTPSIYSGTKSATTTVTGQSEAIATGATKIQVVNKDATNGVYIGFGNSAAEAEAACSSGVAGVSRFLILADSISLQLVKDFTHYAWLGVGGTVSLRITQGV